VELLDGAGADSGIYAHILIDPTDDTATVLKFYTDNTCETAASADSVGSVEFTVGSATAKCFDVAITVSGGTDIAAVSVAQDAADDTLYLIKTYASAHTSTDTCAGTAYDATATTVNACQAITDFWDTDIWVYLGGTESSKLAIEAFTDSSCSTSYAAASGIDLSGDTDCQDIFNDGSNGNLDVSAAPTFTFYEFTDNTCTDAVTVTFTSNTCVATTYTTPAADTPTSFQIYYNLNSESWFSQAYTDSATCAADDAAVADDVFAIDLEDDTTCQQIATGIYATVTSTPSDYTFTTFSDDTCDTATAPTSFDVGLPSCEETTIVSDSAIYAKVMYG
jgi:hypothetical protein